MMSRRRMEMPRSLPAFVEEWLRAALVNACWIFGQAQIGRCGLCLAVSRALRREALNPAPP